MVGKDITQLVLASGSPRRKELLAAMGYSFEVRPSQAEEVVPPSLAAADVAVYLAELKAQAVARAPHELVLTADTVVIVDGMLLGKPQTRLEAEHMLNALSGRWHQVMTGVCLATHQSKHSFATTTEVKFASLTPAQIAAYAATGQPMDKAGAYGIQDSFGLAAVEQIRGSYSNVVGLPTAQLHQRLQELLAS